jgi:hypothetical protein
MPVSTQVRLASRHADLNFADIHYVLGVVHQMGLSTENRQDDVAAIFDDKE